MFSTENYKNDITKYKLNFREKEQEVEMYYLGELTAIINREGFYPVNDTGLGDYCKSSTIQVTKDEKVEVIGINFSLIL
jgi:hypothetical protein